MCVSISTLSGACSSVGRAGWIALAKRVSRARRGPKRQRQATRCGAEVSGVRFEFALRLLIRPGALTKAPRPSPAPPRYV